MRVNCLAQEHNTMTRPGLEPRTLDPESSALTTRPPHLPCVAVKEDLIFVSVLLLSLKAKTIIEFFISKLSLDHGLGFWITVPFPPRNANLWHDKKYYGVTRNGLAYHLKRAINAFLLYG